MDDPRKDTCSRNIFQHEDLKDAVKMAKDPNYFICKSNKIDDLLFFSSSFFLSIERTNLFKFFILKNKFLGTF